MVDVYRMDGTPYPSGHLGMIQWAQDMANIDARRLGLTKIGKDIVVSTVWLGLNHRIGRGQPLIFESMVFKKTKQQEMARYSTKTQAIAGHEIMVARWRQKVKND